MSGHWWDDLTDEQYAWLFKYNTPEQLLGSLRRRGLDLRCTDPDTLAAAAKIQVRYERERAAEGSS